MITFPLNDYFNTDLEYAPAVAALGIISLLSFRCPPFLAESDLATFSSLMPGLFLNNVGVQKSKTNEDKSGHQIMGIICMFPLVFDTIRLKNCKELKAFNSLNTQLQLFLAE